MLTRTLAVAALLATAGLAADPKMTVGKMYDGQLSMVESEIVPAAEAMPADKFGFAPKDGEFKSARTYGQQIKHVASVIYMAAAAAKGEKPPRDLGAGENGPDSVATKEQIVQYLKDSFVYAHKVLNGLTEKNMLEMVKSPFGNDEVPRAGIANATVWHTFDHYGQMVIYLRMNGIVPPASR